VTVARARQTGPAAGHDDYDRELAFALELAARAGDLQVERAERVGQIDHKSAKDVVTEVDHLSEALILDAIRATFPGDALLAEETGEHAAAAGHGPTSGIGRVWIVDPLDGTINYANGIPFYCVSIGLAVAGRPVVGVVHDPVRRESFVATATGPAMLVSGTTLAGPTSAGAVLTASTKERLSDFVVSLALSGRSATTRARAVRRAIRASRSMGSAALALAYVANGRFDAIVQQGGLSTWDIAAAGLIAERAGATVTDLAGGPWFGLSRGPRTIGLLAAPAPHHAGLLGLVSGG
jgi:myo-inositol-1(or 4)-monophosphatase